MQRERAVGLPDGEIMTPEERAEIRSRWPLSGTTDDLGTTAELVNDLLNQLATEMQRTSLLNEELGFKDVEIQSLKAECDQLSGEVANRQRTVEKSTERFIQVVEQRAELKRELAEHAARWGKLWKAIVAKKIDWGLGTSVWNAALNNCLSTIDSLTLAPKEKV